MPELRTRMLWTLAAVALLLSSCSCSRSAEAAGAIEQPVHFSHKVHVVDEEMECSDCHDGVNTVRAGMPDTNECFQCHRAGETDHPDEEVIVGYGRRKEEIPWQQVNRNAGHVYFSHRVHTTLAEIACEECHGAVAELDVPTPRPTAALHSMKACMNCHTARGATNECVVCHQ